MQWGGGQHWHRGTSSCATPAAPGARQGRDREPPRGPVPPAGRERRWQGARGVQMPAPRAWTWDEGRGRGSRPVPLPMRHFLGLQHGWRPTASCIQVHSHPHPDAAPWRGLGGPHASGDAEKSRRSPGLRCQQGDGGGTSRGWGGEPPTHIGASESAELVLQVAGQVVGLLDGLAGAQLLRAVQGGHCRQVAERSAQEGKDPPRVSCRDTALPQGGPCGTGRGKLDTPGHPGGV